MIQFPTNASPGYEWDVYENGSYILILQTDGVTWVKKATERPEELWTRYNNTIYPKQGLKTTIKTAQEIDPIEGEPALIINQRGDAIPIPLSPAYVAAISLPETISLGNLVLFNKKLWRGLLEGESNLPEGTSWPISGYKEIRLFYVQDNTMSPNLSIAISDDPSITFSITRTDVGRFTISSPQINFNNMLQAGLLKISFEDATYLSNDDHLFKVNMAIGQANDSSTLQIAQEGAGIYYDSYPDQKMWITLKIYPN